MAFNLGPHAKHSMGLLFNIVVIIHLSHSSKELAEDRGSEISLTKSLNYFDVRLAFTSFSCQPVLCGGGGRKGVAWWTERRHFENL